MKINLPKSYEHITLRQHQEILDVKDIAKDNYYEFWKGVVSVLSGIESDKIGACDVSEIEGWIKQLDFLDKPVDYPLVEKFSIGTTWYQVNPDVTKLNTDGLIHIINVYRSQSNTIDSDSVALFVTYEGKPFSPEDYLKIKDELYNGCPLSILMPWSRFFFLLLESYVPDMLEYLKQKNLKKLSKTLSQLQTDWQKLKQSS